MLRIGTQATNFGTLSQLESTDMLEGADTSDVIEEQNQNQSQMVPLLSQPRSSGINEVFSQIMGLDIQGILQQQVGLIPFKPPLWSAAFGDANEVDMNDVRQGTIADCFVMSAIASVAQKDPEAIKRMIHDNGDGTYTVTFKQRKNGLCFGPPQYEDKKITVTAKFDGGGYSGDYGEIWPLVIEKAYAEFKKEQLPSIGIFGAVPAGGPYDPIANGGNPADVIEALTGQPAEQRPTTIMGFAAPFDHGEQIKHDFDSGKHIIVGSMNFHGPLMKFDNPYGLVDNHAYTVQNVYKDESGKIWVQLYNPWGTPESQPRPIPYDEVSKYFTNFTIA